MSKRLTIITDDVRASWVGDFEKASAAHNNLHVDVKKEFSCNGPGRCSDVLIDANGVSSCLSDIEHCRECSPNANIFVTATAAPWEDIREACRSGATDVIPREDFEDRKNIDSFIERIVEAPRIMLADNNEELRETLRDQLNDEYEVLEAASPSEAKSILARNDIDLAILDIRLIDDSDDLDTSGLEVAKEAALSVPVIFLTNWATTDSVRTALRRRLNGRRLAAEFIHKHELEDVLLKEDLLLKAVRRVLQLHSSDPPAFREPTSDENHFRELPRVLARLRQTREEINSSYRDVVGREHAWRAFQKLATESLWKAVKDLENDRYRQQIADVLEAGIANLQAFHLTEEHFSAIDLTLSYLSSPEVDEEDVDTCEDAWRDVGVDTLPSLKETLEEWLANSELRLEHAS